MDSKGFDLINGGKFIIEGLNYHFKSFSRVRSRAIQIKPDGEKIEHSTEWYECTKEMKHEVVAYINRFGQFYYYAKSEAVTNEISNAASFIPTIARFIDFRMKQSAHRATDAPRGENPNYMAQLDRLFSTQSLFFGDRMVFQMLLEERDKETSRLSLNFDILAEHDKIISEANQLIEALDQAFRSKS